MDKRKVQEEFVANLQKLLKNPSIEGLEKLLYKKDNCRILVEHRSSFPFLDGDIDSIDPTYRYCINTHICPFDDWDAPDELRHNKTTCILGKIRSFECVHDDEDPDEVLSELILSSFKLLAYLESRENTK